MSKEAKLELDGKSKEAKYTLPTLEGSEGEKAVDISSLRANTGYITLDDGYGNTGSCVSKITFIDGEQRHFALSRHSDRGTGGEIHVLSRRPIWSFTAICRTGAVAAFSDCSRKPIPARGHEVSFRGFPAGAHPMAILSAMINAASCFDEG
jgi:citrate synthase